MFVDTNVLVYARDSSEPEKNRAAMAWMRELWQSRSGRLSHQVLQEYYVTVTRKLRPGLPPAIARDDVRSLMEWDPVQPCPALVEHAWTIEERYGLSFWDALIVAAAAASGAAKLLSEDLQAGASIEGVSIVNPFRAPAADRVNDR